MKNQSSFKKRRLSVMGMTIGPMTAWTVLFFVFPLAYIVSLSFCGRDAYGGIVYAFTLKNYQTLAKPVYMQVLGKTLRMSLIVTCFVTLIAYPYAAIAARAGKRVQNALIAGIMVPFWTNALLRIYAIMNITSANGLINTFLLGLGLVKEPLQILYTDFAVMFGMVYTMTPLMVMPLYANLQKIDGSLLEAGRDLGASPAALFLKVIFPLSIPGIVSGVILVYIPSMFSFYIADALGGGKSIIIGNVISNQFSTSKNWPFGAALAVLVMGLSTLLILAKNLLTKKLDY
ncbi:MAG: ABC transporter permease [Lachnospiraceae bacterium]|nr:ABC transporter permease [Lachnospiraceae bacterium]